MSYSDIEPAKHLLPLRVALPLGIGDAHWACQKLRGLSEYYGGRPIHAYINRSPNHMSVGYLRMVDCVAKAYESPDAPYHLQQEMPPNWQHPRWATLEGTRGWRGFDHIVVANGHLETGNRIETFLPEIATEYTYKLNIPQEAIDNVEPYAGRVLLYLSGTGPNNGFHRGTWTIKNWVRVCGLLNDAGLVPVLVGAHTKDDLGYAGEFRLESKGVVFEDLVGQTDLPQYAAIIRGAACWAGLNSGGGIISAMMGTPTVMLWSDSHWPIPGVTGINLPLNNSMQRSWLSSEQLSTYRTRSFGSPDLTPDNVVNDIIKVMR